MTEPVTQEPATLDGNAGEVKDAAPQTPPKDLEAAKASTVDTSPAALVKPDTVKKEAAVESADTGRSKSMDEGRKGLKALAAFRRSTNATTGTAANAAAADGDKPRDGPKAIEGIASMPFKETAIDLERKLRSLGKKFFKANDSQGQATTEKQGEGQKAGEGDNATETPSAPTKETSGNKHASGGMIGNFTRAVSIRIASGHKDAPTSAEKVEVPILNKEPKAVPQEQQEVAPPLIKPSESVQQHHEATFLEAAIKKGEGIVKIVQKQASRVFPSKEAKVQQSTAVETVPVATVQVDSTPQQAATTEAQQTGEQNKRQSLVGKVLAGAAKVRRGRSTSDEVPASTPVQGESGAQQHLEGNPATVEQTEKDTEHKRDSASPTWKKRLSVLVNKPIVPPKTSEEEGEADVAKVDNAGQQDVKLVESPVKTEAPAITTGTTL